MLKVLLDTNIYISAILFNGKPKLVLQDLIDEAFVGYISNEILDEIEETLTKPKFKLPKDFIQFTIEEIRNVTAIIKNKPLKDYLNLRDRDDFHILETAFSANVDFIITGDKDLLTLEKIKSLKIITPDEYLKIKEELS
ncbi:putative toxin-antitoxin system toxin component, PIN family [Leptospira sp. 2 VSF19]|uniref:Toxin-antitoxin system toxin component, PIN family n=1 Tax=Leptospira soteropolitanensis TaxID=2950025 RepID=A0AAW5VU02_9LEPT|nr:putative toxin-antitoxin system toxin component, PIN family [Leptospira soteropolitanensis]MCW7494806.1 putative toxin-antitoxin system toxin component, PIN family [Leptospira soteropolitanensis]MCW7502398.1 putative toxin-antitoxin system toxin component, PIN family [Leptospira soteropolitanensis]MCW7524635.1 putative toxin-antitoxin system toxin component, PIN family [Leptospira soteropolitanensis]MCW7528504.1 putative toxin-antitoxin system toxin component, PIN family [Leptospira soteropo